MWQRCELYLFCFSLNMKPVTVCLLSLCWCTEVFFFPFLFAAHNHTNFAGRYSTSPAGAIKCLPDSANWKWHSAMHVAACRESRFQMDHSYHLIHYNQQHRKKPNSHKCWFNWYPVESAGFSVHGVRNQPHRFSAGTVHTLFLGCDHLMSPGVVDSFVPEGAWHLLRLSERGSTCS